MDVGGSVRVGDDTSSDIFVEQVGGDCTVRDDTSGDIRFEDVAGSISILESGWLPATTGCQQ